MTSPGQRGGTGRISIAIRFTGRFAQSGKHLLPYAFTIRTRPSLLA